ncbi:MAG: hypothetical protein V4487_03300 [Chlamydiota bacterium]
MILIITASLHAEEKSYFGYGDIHAMGGYPMLGIGVRAKTGIHCLDLSGNISPLPGLLHGKFSPALFHVRGLYLIYPQQEGIYLGGGLGFLNEPETLVHPGGSFEGALGYQWRRAHKNPLFLEANAIAPFEKPGGKSLRVWPGLTFGLGF